MADEVVHLESGYMPACVVGRAPVYWAAADSYGAEQRHSADRPDLARSFAAHVTAGELSYTLAVHAGLSKEPGVAGIRTFTWCSRSG